MTPAAAPERVAEEIEALVGSGRFGDAFQRFTSDESVRHASAQVELALAMAAARLGEYRRAVDLASSALGRFAKERNPAGQMRAFNLLGGVAFEQGRLDEAEICFRDAERLAVSVGDPIAQAKTRNNRAMIAHLRGRAYLAVEYWRGALILYEAQRDFRGALQTHYNLGLAYRELGLFRASRDHNARASALLAQVPDPALEGVVLLGKAELAFAESEISAAEELVERAAILAQSSGDQAGQIAVHRLRALMRIDAGDHEAGRAEAGAGRELAIRLGARLLATECAVIQALALAGAGHLDRGEELFKQSVQSLEGLGATRLIAWADREWVRTQPGSI